MEEQNLQDFNFKNPNRYKFSLCVLGSVIILLLLYIAFNQNGDSGSKEKVEILEKGISNIQKGVDSLTKANEKIDKDIGALQKPLKEIDQNIDNNNSKIDKLKKYEKDTHASFNGYTVSEWEKFFSNRYQDRK